ncbi:MAG: rod shape-determining protein, partial [Bacteroidales bacterium]|nr:rod shape-determining protein [Bacteroidales bacterium]
MGLFSLFSFTQEIAIDLGTANVIIMHNNNVVVDQPSIVAIDQNTGKMIALGSQARLME